VTPATALDNSVTLLSNMAERKNGSVNLSTSYDLLSKKTWITLSCGDEVNIRCEQILTTEWSLRSKYDVFRTSNTEWVVLQTGQSVSQKNRVIPLFKRTREVSVNENSTFFCSCNMFERFGIPCRHIFAVFNTFPMYDEPNKYDVSVMYWKHYAHYCHSNNNDILSKKMDYLLSHLQENDILGPSCPETLYIDLPITTTLPHDFVNAGKVVCVNYCIDEIINTVHKHIPSGYGVSMSLTQEDEKEVVDDPILSVPADFVSSTKSKSKRKAYFELIPIFRELVQRLENNDVSHTNRVKTVLINELNTMRCLKCEPTKVPKGTFVSSHTNFVKKRKTHGTNYYKK